MTPEEQKVRQTIGNAVGEAKRRLFDRLNAGADLDTAIAQFIGELRLALDGLVMNR